MGSPSKPGKSEDCIESSTAKQKVSCKYEFESKKDSNQQTDDQFSSHQYLFQPAQKAVYQCNCRT